MLRRELYANLLGDTTYCGVRSHFAIAKVRYGILVQAGIEACQSLPT